MPTIVIMVPLAGIVELDVLHSQVDRHLDSIRREVAGAGGVVFEVAGAVKATPSLIIALKGQDDLPFAGLRIPDRKGEGEDEGCERT